MCTWAGIRVCSLKFLYSKHASKCRQFQLIYQHQRYTSISYILAHTNIFLYSHWFQIVTVHVHLCDIGCVRILFFDAIYLFFSFLSPFLDVCHQVRTDCCLFNQQLTVAFIFFIFTLVALQPSSTILASFF